MEDKNYIDCFLFPIATKDLPKYEAISKKVAAIWKEHGALQYFEFTGDALSMPGTLSFPDLLEAKENETIVFGYAVFNSREEREEAHRLVAKDPRMGELVAPLMEGDEKVFDPGRMVFGKFKKLFGL